MTEDKSVDVEPTAHKIDEMAKTLKRSAITIEKAARRMREDGDLYYAAEVITEVVNLISNLRLDLMVTRPIRALERK